MASAIRLTLIGELRAYDEELWKLEEELVADGRLPPYLARSLMGGSNAYRRGWNQ